jgi:hypothetical protein
MRYQTALLPDDHPTKWYFVETLGERGKLLLSPLDQSATLIETLVGPAGFEPTT